MVDELVGIKVVVVFGRVWRWRPNSCLRSGSPRSTSTLLFMTHFFNLLMFLGISEAFSM
jgi:hypothetical protein